MNRRIQEGDIFPTNKCGNVTVIRYGGMKDVDIKFNDTGTILTTSTNNIRGGELKDKYRPSVCRVGFVGEGSYKTSIKSVLTSAYIRWCEMLRRCYSEKAVGWSRYGGRGVTVCKEWHNFQNFSEWFYLHYTEGYEIDKDIINQGAREYNPDNCRFVPPRVNALLLNRHSARGAYPVGVCYCKSDTGYNYQANVNVVEQGQEYLGAYTTPEAAFEVYKKAKLIIMERVAKDHYERGEITKEIYEALLRYEIVPYPE